MSIRWYIRVNSRFSTKMKAFLIDANALIHRIYHAMPKLTDSQGRPVQALYGLANMLLKILNEQKPNYIIALADRPEPTIRHQVFKDYKATRPKTTDDLKGQISLSKKIFDGFNIPLVEKIGYEADDLIATLKEKLLPRVDEIIILTGDFDTLQLVDSKTKILTMQRGISKTVLYDETKVQERFNVLPCQITDYKALIGDSSDNIIGIEGIGPKTASELLKKYKDIDGIINAAKQNKIQTNLANKILENKEKLLFNKDLVTLRHNIDIDESFLSPYKGYDVNKLIEVFKEFGFRSLINRLETVNNILNNQVDKKQTLFTNNKIISNKQFLIEDIESPFFFFDNQNQIIVDDGSGEIKFFNRDSLKDILMKNSEKYTFDLKSFFKEIFKTDFYFDKKIDLQKIYDLKIIFWLLNPSKGYMSLEEIVSFVSHQQNFSFNLLLKTAQNLFLKLKENNLDSVYYNFELPLVAALARLELRGIKIDIFNLEKLKAKIKEKTAQLLQEIENLAQEKFNPQSPVQLRKILFEKLKLPTKGLSKTSKGEISTQSDDLLKIVNLHPIVDKILDYRKMNKILTTYTDSLLKNYNDQSKKIYTIFNQTGTTTGRIVSESPNLQNLPLEGELGQYIRSVFVAETDYIFISADYSQIELRLLAHLSQDENLITAFQKNLDIHSQTAKIVFGDDSQESRRKAKIINFGICYGISAKGLAQRLQIPVSEASKLIERFFYFYPGVKKLKDDLIDFAKTYGFAETLFGRKRFIPEINYQSYREKSAAERIAINMPIQGLAADILKKAMIEIDNEIYQKNLQAYFVLTIHDEIIFEVKKEIKEEFKGIIKEKMERVVDLSVPLRVNIKEGDNLSFSNNSLLNNGKLYQ